MNILQQKDWGNTKGCIKAVTSASSAKPWDLEIQSEAIPVIEGHRYQISFFIKSEGVGAVRLAFERNEYIVP